MRLALLSLVLGILVGFAARSFLIGHPLHHFAFSPATRPLPEAGRPLARGPTKPIIYPSPEKTIARLRKQFDEAVVVVLADESYDDHRQLVKIAVVEVWKGPGDLVGKTMDSRLEPPLSYLHSVAKERVLRFMPMTPHLDTSGSVFFDGETLRMNPVLSISLLKDALVNRQAKG